MKTISASRTACASALRTLAGLVHHRTLDTLDTPAPLGRRSTSAPHLPEGTQGARGQAAMVKPQRLKWDRLARAPRPAAPATRNFRWLIEIAEQRTLRRARAQWRRGR